MAVTNARRFMKRSATWGDNKLQRTHKGRVPLVDGPTDQLTMYADYLVALGFSVHATTDSTSIERIAPPPDVAVISLVMPTTSGAEVARAIRHKWQIPVILLSTVPPASVPEDVKRATHVRCVAITCLPEDLVKHIDSITTRR